MIVIKSKNVLDIITGSNIVIPRYLLKYYKNIGLSVSEMIFIAYLMGYNGDIAFDITTFSNDLSFTSDEIMNMLGRLCENNIISMDVKKCNDVMKEYLDISFLYNKLLLFVMQDDDSLVTPKEANTNIYEEIEKEFGRTLSPIEYETIKGWIDANVSEELIHEALKEAVLNGVTNLKYIDKILFEWIKKGYKKKSDIVKKNNKEEVIDIFDYDWLKDNE